MIKCEKLSHDWRAKQVKHTSKSAGVESLNKPLRVSQFSVDFFCLTVPKNVVRVPPVFKKFGLLKNSGNQNGGVSRVVTILVGKFSVRVPRYFVRGTTLVFRSICCLFLPSKVFDKKITEEWIDHEEKSRSIGS